MNENKAVKYSSLKNILWKLFRMEAEKQEVPESTTEMMKHLLNQIDKEE